MYGASDLQCDQSMFDLKLDAKIVDEDYTF